MYEGFDIWSFLIGLPLAAVIASIIIFISWRRGKKKRIFDERYTKVHRHARTISWFVTTFTILIIWGIIIIFEGPGLSFFLITALWVIHMLSYLIGTFIANRNN